MRKAPLTLTVLALAMLALGACTNHASAPGEVQAAASSPPSLPAALDNVDGLQTMAEALKVTGVAQTFDGKGSFTLLAPEDDAFDAAGDPDSKLMAPGDHTALAELVWNHMLPGYMTPQDLSAAIDASRNGQITMPSLGGEDLTFARIGKAITVTAPDGSRAMLDGDPVAGGSSIAIPISGVLRKHRTDGNST